MLVKDAHQHPAVLLGADLTVLHHGVPVHRETLIHQPIRLMDEWLWSIFDVRLNDVCGWVECVVRFTLSAQGKTRTYTTHNYRTASHSPLRVYRSRTPLPCFPGFLNGETHAHSSYTSDQVEFGLPLRPTRYLSRALGLDYLCITDHSYDLDDSPTSYLVNDPHLRKWKGFLAEADELNDDGKGPTIVRGEEVTVRNAEGRNVHCLVYGDRTFHPGAGDSAEKWLQTTSELSSEELMGIVSGDAGVFAAHIADDIPFLQRLLLWRGKWSEHDISHRRLDGVQFWNGTQDEAMARGKRMWINQLLKGQRSVCVAGNDAHGNFNRFLQLRVPFLLMHDRDHQLFGRVRTLVHSALRDEASILIALRRGRSVMSDGPVAAVYSPDGTMLIGSSIACGDPIIVRAASTQEFGPVETVRLMLGTADSNDEVCLHTWTPGADEFRSPAIEIPIGTRYVRVEATTNGGDAYHRSHLALTNPVWVSDRP